MLNWIRASYEIGEINPRAYITTLEFVGVKGAYHVYKTCNGIHIATYNNQPTVRNYIDENLGSIFMVRFLHEDNNKYAYTVELNKETIPVITIASVVVLIQGSEQEPRGLHYDSDDLVYID